MRIVPISVVVLAGVGALGASGCSSFGGTFGVSSQAYKLTEDAKAVRATNTVAATIPKETQKSLHPAFVVEPGDTLLVQPADLDSPIRLPGDQPVLPDGTIDLGRFGHPIVAGKTLLQIEVDIAAVVQAGLKAEAEKAKTSQTEKTEPAGPVIINVRLVGRASKVYYVLGEVNAAGAFPITGRETVLDGILAAGNLSRNASHHNIILSRPTSPDGCRIVLPICWNDIVQLADPSTNYQLMPGDRIFVASKAPLEDYRIKKHGECPPCNRPQIPCGTGACAPSAEASLPAVLPIGN